MSVLVMFAAFLVYVVASEWRRVEQAKRLTDQRQALVALIEALQTQRTHLVAREKLIDALKAANTEKDAVVRSVLTAPLVSSRRAETVTAH